MARAEESLSSLHRAIDILLLLQQEGKEMGVSEIARALGANKTTVYRALATLEERDFVQKTNEAGRYWLGLRLYSLGMTIGDNLPLKATAEPHLKALSNRFNEVANLAVLDRSATVSPRLMIIDKIQTYQLLSMTPPAGSSTPCHCSAVGKCLLAFSPDEYIGKFVGGALEKYTEKTVTSWPELLQRLSLIRNQGFAIDDEELEMGLICIAAPVLNRKQELVAAVSISGPNSRITSRLMPEVIDAVKNTARTISLQIH